MTLASTGVFMALDSQRSLRTSRAVQRAATLIKLDWPALRGWLRHGAHVLLLIPVTQFGAWVLTLLLPGIFARAFGPGATAPEVLAIGAYTLVSVLRALFAFRFVEAEHPGTSTGAWVAASMLCDGILQLGAPALLPLTPLGGRLGDALIEALSLIGGGALTALLQWRLFSPRARWSWVWIAGTALGWAICALF